MKAYIDIMLVALVTIYLVEVSGFTQAWRNALARLLHIKVVKPLPPLDNCRAMTLIVCCIYAAAAGTFGIGTLAASALMSLLSIPISRLMIFVERRITL